MSDESTDRDDAGADSPRQGAAGKSATRAFEIGYGKPPKATQFKKGQSGNPKGGKKAEPIEDVRIVIENVLAEQTKVRDGGKFRTVSNLEAIMQAQRINALKGNPKAVRTLFKLGQKNGLFSKAKPRGGIVIDPAGTDDEKMIMRAFEAQRDARATSLYETDEPSPAPRRGAAR
jgi:hypothetical protein